MAWTTPRTWVTGELVTASIMNTHVRDNLSHLGTRPTCRAVMNGSPLSVPNSTDTLIPFDGTDLVDTDSMHDPASNNTRITFNTGGTYLVGFRLFWGGHADSGARGIKMRKNGSTVLIYAQTQPDGAGSPQGLSVDASDIFVFSATDYIELLAFHTAGSTITVGSGATAEYSSFFATQIGA